MSEAYPSCGFIGIEGVADLAEEFLHGGLGFGTLRDVFCEGLDTDDDLPLPLHVGVVGRCGHALAFEYDALGAVIAPAGLDDVATHLAEHSPAVRPVRFSDSARGHGVPRAASHSESVSVNGTKVPISTNPRFPEIRAPKNDSTGRANASLERCRESPIIE